MWRYPFCCPEIVVLHSNNREWALLVGVTSFPRSGFRSCKLAARRRQRSIRCISEAIPPISVF
jgi:hypothetical protein